MGLSARARQFLTMAAFAICVVVTVATALRVLPPWIDRALASAGDAAKTSPDVPYGAISIAVIAFGLTSTVLMLASGWLIYRARSRTLFGSVVAYNSIVLAFAVIGPWFFAPSSSAHDVITRAITSLALVTLLWATLAFPDGRFVPSGARWLLLPFGMWQLARAFDPRFGVEQLGWPWPLILLAFYLAASLTQVYRYAARATSEHRVQLKWWLFGANVITVMYVGATAAQFLIPRPSGGEPAFWFAGIASSAFPAAVLSAVAIYTGHCVFAACLTISILRYAWFDIDVVVSRTLAYGIATALLVGAIAGLSVAVSRVVGAGAGLGTELTVTFSVAIALGAVFLPLRRSIEAAADRLVAQHADLALLFVDIVGSTSRLSEVGDRSWATTLARFRALVRREFELNGGQEVGTAGDDFFATFATAEAAVNAACGVRRSVASIGVDVRTGVHAGRCELRGRQPIGVNVHVAARLERLAGPGEIVVSAAVADQLHGTAHAVRDLGTHSLRGVPGAWQVFAIQ